VGALFVMSGYGDALPAGQARGNRQAARQRLAIAIKKEIAEGCIPHGSGMAVDGMDQFKFAKFALLAFQNVCLGLDPVDQFFRDIAVNQMVD
jgi:hypothetical protein